MSTPKIPFDFGLFFFAVQHALGEPYEKYNYGLDGSYDWYWVINTRERRKEAEEHLAGIRRWMKYFDLLWPESRCEIARWEDVPEPKKLYLRITIRHEVKKVEG